MLFCKNDRKYVCTTPTITTHDGTSSLAEFIMIEALPPAELESLFSNNDFYIYDAFLEKVLFDARNTKLQYLNMTYLENSTCKIKIKTIKGDAENES